MNRAFLIFPTRKIEAHVDKTEFCFFRKSIMTCGRGEQIEQLVILLSEYHEHLSEGDVSAIYKLLV